MLINGDLSNTEDQGDDALINDDAEEESVEPEEGAQSENEGADVCDSMQHH